VGHGGDRQAGQGRDVPQSRVWPPVHRLTMPLTDRVGISEHARGRAM
jgi:hypothetical protein